ncbi:MAG: hypothetical protein GY757_23560, partial [bacterium]|nr:hypothetical protein [bacterium]
MMRPEKKKLYTRASADAGVRMRIKTYLFWITGFPTGLNKQGLLNWVIVPGGQSKKTEQVLLDGEHLSKATYTVNKLRREFPRALPRIVGDADKWGDGVHRLLEFLKPAIHQGKKLPTGLFEAGGPYSPALSKQALQTAALHPLLKPLID